MTLRPFRFGVTAPTVLSGSAWVERARRIERLGYSIVHVPDHFRDQLAPVPALTAAAMATTRLRVGSLVFSNDFRHPVVLAKEAATLDVLSGGRFELGLGIRLAARGIRPGRHPVRRAGDADRAARGVRRHRQGAARRRAGDVHRPALRDRGAPGAAACRSSDRTRPS